MTDVIAQKEFVDLVLYLFIGFGIAFFALLTAWTYDHFKRTPQAAKTVKAAHLQHRGIIVTQGDQGQVKFRIGFKVRPEGIVETRPEGKKPKRFWTGLMARKVEIPQVLEREGDSVEDRAEQDMKISIAGMLSDEATTPTILDGAGVPIMFGYDGKAILTRVGHLANLKLLEGVKKYFPDALVSVDFTTLKTLFPMPWDETQVDAQGQMKFNEGFEAGRRLEDKDRAFKILLLMLIGALGFGVLLFAVIKYL